MKKLFIISLVLLVFACIGYFGYTQAQEAPLHDQGDKWGPPPNGEGPDDHFGPPPGKHEGDGPPHGPMPELTDEQIAKLMTFIQQYFPTFYSVAQELKENNPMEYKKMVMERVPVVMKLKEIMGKDKELFDTIVKKVDLEDKSMALAKKYRESSNDAEKKQIEADMGKIVSELFDLRQKEEKMHADRMEKELKHMREVISERDKNKAAIIQDRINELTGKKEYMSW